MKHKKQKKGKKQKELKAPSKRRANIMILMTLTVSVGILWFIFDAHLEHRNQHYAEDVTKQYKKQSIKELKEIVRKDPNNFSAWKLLGLKYRQEKKYVKAKESWNRALEIAHSEDEISWLEEKLDHIDKHHN